MINTLREIKLKELLRFLVGGGSAVLTDYIVYSILRDYCGTSIAKMISFILGAFVGFVINKLWTFESKQFRIVEIVKYIILYACSATVNMLVNDCALYLFPYTVFAFLCATGVSTVINFLGQKFFVFRGIK